MRETHRVKQSFDEVRFTHPTSGDDASVAMTDDVRPGELFEIESADSGGLLTHLPWWLIAAVAFAVAELTAHPSIGVIVLCLKFGWNDFLTALWLQLRSPHRRQV